MKFALVLALLASCGIEQDTEGFVVGLAGKGCDGYTLIDSTDTCGQVFVCDLGSQFYRAAPANQHTTTPELCWVDDSPDELQGALQERFSSATCSPSPRGNVFGWPCLYHCGGAAHRGCNAFQGCYCP